MRSLRGRSVSRMSRLVVIFVVLVAGAGFALVACAASGTTSTSSTSAATTTTSGTTASSNRAAARAAAVRIFAQVPLPPGATRASSDPSSSTWLRTPATGAPANPDLVDIQGFWRVPGDPHSVFRWLHAHAPAGTRVFVTGTGGQRGKIVMWTLAFSYPALTGRVSPEGLGVAVTAAHGGGTAMRADTFAVWLIPRPAAEVVPAGIRAVAVYVDHFDGSAVPVSTVTAKWKIRRLIAFIDSRELRQPGAMSCPAITPSTPLLDLRFLRAAGTAPLARAVEDGCGGLSFWIRGRRWPGLAEGGNLAGRLRKLAFARPGSASPGSHRQELKCLDVPWTDDGEVPMVESRELRLA